jgi:quercetin dioxygenase-like cupin family protein
MRQILVPPGGGIATGDDAFSPVIKLSGEATRGVIGIIEQSLRPMRMISPHVHEHDVWLFVLEGQVGARVGDETVLADAGAYVLKPRNIVHTIWNQNPGPCRMVEIFTPAGFDKFMAEVEALSQRGSLDEGTFEDLCDRYGIHYFDDWPGDEGWVEKMRSEKGLKLLSEE